MSAIIMKQHLSVLESILDQERYAITHLQMERLKRLGTKKLELIKAIREVAGEVDEESMTLITRISRSNQRNATLLKRGLIAIGRLQDNAFRSMALTYRRYGDGPLEIGSGPRVYSRRF